MTEGEKTNQTTPQSPAATAPLTRGAYRKGAPMKKLTKVFIFVFLIITFLCYTIYLTFFDIQHIKGQEYLKESSSPDGRYTVTAYLNNGGATTAYAVLCSVTDNETGKERNIYWDYRRDDAIIIWKNENTVIINNIELNVTKDTYDFRNK